MFDALAHQDVQDSLQRLGRTVDLKGECKSIEILIDAFNQTLSEAQCACQSATNEGDYRRMVSLRDAMEAVVRVLSRLRASDVRVEMF